MAHPFDAIFGHNPGRPDHPDFWKLSDQVLKLDGRMQAAPDDEAKERVWQESVAEADIDMECLVYMATQRVFRILGIQTKADLFAKSTEVAKLTTVYMEGFLIGSMFQKER